MRKMLIFVLVLLFVTISLMVLKCNQVAEFDTNFDLNHSEIK